MRELRVAILSPGVDVYSETFILNHKQKLSGDIFFYYDGVIPTRYDGKYDPSKFVLSEKEEALTLDQEHIRRLYRLKNSLELNKIDVVLCEYGTSAAYSLPAIKSLGLPVVVHFHGYDAYETEVLTKQKENYREVFSYASRVVAVSEAMRQQLTDIGCPADKIVCVPCGARQIFFHAKPKFQSKQFLTAGRFVQKKAPYYTILAFNEVARSYPDARLKMLAEGPLLDICKRIVKYCGIEDKVTFSGAVFGDAVMKEMENSLALVQHSIVALNGDSEGTPVAVLEAGAAGIPVVATKHAGIPEVVVDSETGLLVEEHDVMGMAKAMSQLLDDPNYAKRMGSNARKYVRQNFSDVVSVYKLDEVITSAYKNHTKLSSQEDWIYQAALKEDKYRNKLLLKKNEQLRRKSEQLKKDITDLKASTRWKIGNSIVSVVRLILKAPVKLSSLANNIVRHKNKVN